MEHLLQNLTEAQREAVLHHDGPLLILAGPGSGKTRVITHRIARMLADGVPGHQILALTFTNKAADEMRLRVQRLAPGSQVWIGTFHRFCARLLRKYAPLVGLEENYTIYDTGDSAQALRRAMGQLQIDAAFASPESIARAISWAKNNLITPDQYHPKSGNPLGSIVQKIYPAYQAKLASFQRRRFRRSAAARRHDASRESRSAGVTSTSATAISWSTNIRTRTWPNTPSPGPSRSTIRTWR